MDDGELAELLREHALRHSVPGAAIGIHQAGSSTTAYYGVADVTTGEVITPSTCFSTGSLTKPMVATVVARLAEERLLSLDDPVDVHVPELRGITWAERATLRDLLANRSGLPLGSELEFGFVHREGQEISRLAEDVAAMNPASAVWSYTNVGWCLLGRVIETATGQSWPDAMRLYLFEQAGMRRTAFATEAIQSRRAAGHEFADGGMVPVAPLVSRAYAPAGTSIVATLPDILSFAALHLEDQTLAQLRTTHADVSIYTWLDSWGLGWARFDWEDSVVWGWDGLISGERSFVRIVPEHNAAVVLMTNSGTGRAMYRSLFAELMQSSFGVGVPRLRLAVAPNAPNDLSRFAGTYAWPDRRIEVIAGVSGLTIRSDEGEVAAQPLDGRTFLVDPSDPDNPTVTFGAFDTTGRPNAVYLMLWGLPRDEESHRNAD